jgi:predicted CXXCH cytochrome family protein
VRAFSKRILLLVVLSTGIASIMYGVVLPPKANHLADEHCGSCHLTESGVTPTNASKLMASQELLCARCHADALKMSHPSGFVPRRVLGAEYPLDWKGELTCSSCHDPHGVSPGLLRGNKRNKDMCLSCHDINFFYQMKDSGISISHSGHLNATRLDLSTLDIDRYSLECMGCHGNSGESSQVTIGSNAILRHSSGSANHPIGRSYADAFAAGGYRPQSMLSKNVWLPDGKISCVSCHDGYNKKHGKVIVPSRGAGLCYECHDK